MKKTKELKKMVYHVNKTMKIYKRKNQGRWETAEWDNDPILIPNMLYWTIQHNCVLSITVVDGEGHGGRSSHILNYPLAGVNLFEEYYPEVKEKK